MIKLLLTVIFFGAFLAVHAQDGYAMVNGVTTGGKGGPIHTVTTWAEFTDAVKPDTPKIVYVKGPIVASGLAAIGSNTSIIGLGLRGVITNGGFRIIKKSNVIVRNMVLNKVKGNDAITLQSSHHIWIDHNEFYSDTDHDFDFYDGQIDITHACDFITISWNYFHDHFKCSLIGHDPANGPEDTGKFHITYHHNRWRNIHTRTPAMRFAHVHSYNNVFDDIVSQGIHSRSGSQVLIEGNVFRNSKEPVSTYGFVIPDDSPIDPEGDFEPDGFANFGAANDFGGGKNNITATGDFTSVPYRYSLTPLLLVRLIVTIGAGVGRVLF